MSYPNIPIHTCELCGQKFFTEYAKASHKAQVHHRPTNFTLLPRPQAEVLERFFTLNPDLPREKS